MASKPSTPAEWDSNGTNTSPTTAGHKADGWANNEVPTAAEFNYWMKQVADWTKWLYDGDISIPRLVVTKNISFTGTSASDYDMGGINQISLDPDGTGNVDNYHTIYLAPNVENLIIHGIAVDAGTQDGRQITLLNNGSLNIKLRIGSTSANVGETMFWGFSPAFAPTGLNEDIILAGGCTVTLEYDLRNYQWNIVSASGCLIKRKFMIPSSAATLLATSTSSYNQGYILMADAIAVHFPVIIPSGGIIDSWKLYFKKLSSGATTLSARMKSRAGDSDTINDVGTNQTNNENAVGYRTLSATSIAETVQGATFAGGWNVTTKAYWVQVGVTTTEALDRVLHLEVTAWVPI